jgi:hypothetical protein
MSAGVNRLARVLDERMKSHDDKPSILDFATIQADMSLLTNKFPKPIPYEDYCVCRSVSYDPEIPLSVTWWQDEGWNSQTEKSDFISSGQKNQPQHWTTNGEPKEHLNRWGELMNENSGERYWKEKHMTPEEKNHIHNSKGEHDHEEDPDGKHYHTVYLPRKMYRIQPGDRVLIAWVGDDVCVIDIVMAAKEMM